jgi:hypothetical protein
MAMVIMDYGAADGKTLDQNSSVIQYHEYPFPDRIAVDASACEDVACPRLRVDPVQR